MPQEFVHEVVASWVGFANEPAAPPGTRKPTTEWPIQKYLWSEFMVGPGDQVADQAVPVVGQASALRRQQDLASALPPSRCPSAPRVGG